jgi:hypothetical protein
MELRRNADCVRQDAGEEAGKALRLNGSSGALLPE